MFGSDAAWTLDRHLAAASLHHLAVANWQRASGKKRDYPKPIPRPGVPTSGGRVGDSSRMTPTETRRLLDSFKPKR